MPGGVTQEVKLGQQVSLSVKGRDYNVVRKPGDKFIITPVVNGELNGEAVKLVGARSLIGGNNKVKATPVFSMPGVAAPLFVPVTSVRKETSFSQTKDRLEGYAGRAYLSTQILTGGNAQTGPVLKNIDIEVIRKNNNGLMNKYLPRVADLIRPGQFTFNTLVSDVRYQSPSRLAATDIAFGYRLLSQGSAEKALEYGLKALKAQTEEERYAASSLSDADKELRQSRASGPLEYYEPLLSVYRQAPVNGLLENTARDLLHDMDLMNNVWANPRHYKELVDNGKLAELIKENAGAEKIKIAHDQLIDAAVEAKDRKLATLSEFAKLAEYKEETRGLLTGDKAPKVELMFPEMMKDKDRGRTAYAYATKDETGKDRPATVQISWANVDGVGKISDRTLWEFDFLHEYIDHHILHSTGILPLNTNNYTRALSEVSAQYSSVMRVIETAKMDKEFARSKMLYGLVLGPLVNINSRWQLHKANANYNL